MKVSKIKSEILFELENVKEFFKKHEDEVFPVILSENDDDEDIALLDVFFGGERYKLSRMRHRLKEWVDDEEIGRIKIGNKYYYQRMEVIEDIKKNIIV